MHEIIHVRWRQRLEHRVVPFEANLIPTDMRNDQRLPAHILVGKASHATGEPTQARREPMLFAYIE